MPSKMLERVLSVRRAVSSRSDATSSVEFENVNDEATADAAADDEKAKKQQHQQIRIATRAVANYLTRMRPFGLCLVFLSLAFLSILSLYLFHSYDPLTRSGFFGLDGLKTDFGSLGVPWLRHRWI
uniref:Uncharacterized protein n=1 Tax=Quercus lobata TaxID=97700 RepID=A0A7N2MYQ5_QUELO